MHFTMLSRNQLKSNQMLKGNAQILAALELEMSARKHTNKLVNKHETRARVDGNLSNHPAQENKCWRLGTRENSKISNPRSLPVGLLLFLTEE